MDKFNNRPPLYMRLYSLLKQRIEAGEWGFGAMLPSENELCEMFRTSRGTIRQVLAELESEGLVRRERGRGTFVARAGLQRAAPGVHSRSIAFIVPYVRDSFVSSILLGLESAARAGGYGILFNHVENQLEKQAQALRMAVQQGIAGIVLYPVNSKDACPVLHELILKNAPLVQVDRYVRGLYTDQVTSDNFGGGMIATQHLLWLGHRRIGFLSWLEPATSMEHRRAGYRQALVEAGLLPAPDLEWDVEGYPDIDEAALEERLRSADRPSAVFAANDQLALAVQRVARRLKISIPGELALVGFDNLEISAQLDIPLTTIAQPAFEIGRTAGELVLCKIRQETACIEKRVLPVQLLVRRSCGML